jgi:hypothetical protein
MASKYTVEVDVNAPGLDETADGFVRLQKQIQDTRIEMQKAAEVGDTIKFNELRSQLNDLNDKFEKVQLQSKEFHDALATMPGPAGKVGQAIQQVNGAFKSLLANPVIAIIAGIAGVFLIMYEALKKTAEGQKALSAVTDAFGRIVTPIIKFISAVAVPVFNALASAIDFVSAAFRDFSGSYAEFKKEVADDTAMRQAEENAKRIAKFIEEEGYKFDEFTIKKLQAKQKYNEKVKDILADEMRTEAQKDKAILNAGLEVNKKLADIDKERATKNAAAQKVITDKAKSEADKNFNEKIARMGAEDKLDEAKLEKMKAEELATAKTEANKFAIESKYANEKYNLQRNNILQLQGEYEKDSKEYMDYQAQLINLDAGRITQLTLDSEKKKKLKDDEFKKQQETDALLDSLAIAAMTKEEEREQAAFDSKRRREKADLTASEEFLKSSEQRKKELLDQFDQGTEVLDNKRKDDKKKKALQEELEILNIRKNAAIPGTRAYFDLLREIEKNAYDQKVIDAKGNNEKLIALREELKERTKAINKQELESYLATASQALGGVSNILSMASNNMKMQQDIDIANAEGNEEKITEIKKKAFEENKKMQIAQAIIGTLQGAIQAYQSMAMIPVVGPALGIAAAAAALVFGYKQVQLIKQTKYTDSSAKGSSSSAKPDTPAFNGTMNVPAPQIGASSAQSSGNLGQVIGTSMEANNSRTRPIQAYVVGDQVSTQQQLDRRISVAAKMGGG